MRLVGWCLVSGFCSSSHYAIPQGYCRQHVAVARTICWRQRHLELRSLDLPERQRSSVIIGVRNCHESVYLGRHCLCDAGHGQVGEKNAVAHRCPLHGGVLGSDGGRRPLGSCFSQSSSWLARADAHVPLHVCVCDFLVRGAVGLPQRHLSHEREGESHVHVGLLPMGRQFPHRVLGPSAGSLDERARYVCILRRVLRRRFRVGLCFRPGNEGFALGGDGQVVRRTSRGPRRVCSSNMLGFSVSVWLVCGWVSRVHWDMSWCLCLCVCVDPPLPLSFC